MAKTGHPNFVMEFTSQWRGGPHVWSIASSHSGTSFTSATDQKAFLISVYQTIRLYISASDSTTYISGLKYYDGINSVPLYEEFFANETEAATYGVPLGGQSVTANQGEAFVGSETVQMTSGLETCTMLTAPVGLSSKGKPVFLKKYIHCAPAAQVGSTVDGPDYASGGAAYAANLGNGSLYGSRVLCSSSGKQGTWVASPYFGNHQMPRRSKKKTS